MSVPCKFERSLLGHDEYETIRLTHHPTIYEVEPAELEAIRSRLRKMRDKEQTLERAVASSAAIPGVWPPITIMGQRYIDGGVRSMLNADLATGCDTVVVVSCFALEVVGKNADMATLNAALIGELGALRNFDPESS